MSRRTLQLVVVCLCTVAAASAAPIRWTLTNVTFADGATASGSFIYDANTNTYSAVSIATTTTATFTGQAYITAVTPESSAIFAVVVTTGAFTTGTPDFFLLPVSSLTNAGGTLALTVGASPSSDSSEGQCANMACTAPAVSPIRQVATGSLVGAPVAATVPTLGSVGLAILSVLLAASAFLLMRRRELVG
jgi:hypothetical protein